MALDQVDQAIISQALIAAAQEKTADSPPEDNRFATTGRSGLLPYRSY